jgi:hypothetical protein
MALIRDVAIALVSVFLTVLFDVITLAVTDMPRLQQGPDAVLAVHFDLIIISMSILLGALVSTTSLPKKAYLVLPIVLTIVALVLCLASVALSAVPWRLFDQVFLAVWLPDIIAFASLGLSIHAAWEKR